MSKNINVKLTFSADTKAAQQQINQLQQTLSNIAATPISGSGLKATAQEIQVATNKAVELKVALNNATNVNTGKLNFNKFSQELKRNKTTLQEYAMQLQKLGPQGVQAFSQMATAIRQSETPLVAMQGKLAALGQTFMNTVKWSISSSIIQGVTGAFSSTIDYAKELNESLTNIRIVTGKSVADVSKFAVEANKAAKALSATTNEYAKASLIYFQQGLNDSAVAERTETTLKLAKVVGESAETTSEWMTAIWNNFGDGSRSLENYADVLAKLGAATASSADEIAGGLEKFAAVAETVGLSYEYAASALATITAETRQSEDVVGTALKTIFARVENLKLGETLEDGTTLGQYSKALAKVGVNIKDSNGQLKEMDDILSNIGTTWAVLDRDQQVALAQQVAGIRQYSQFMALMDNWDTMEENIEIAKEANGALEDQHKIWETGIEGATSRVKEELNEIKNNLLGENDLLPLLNIAEGFLDFIGDLIDSLGGLPGLLSIVASVGLKLWGPQAAAGLQNMVNGVKSLYSVVSGSTQADRSAMIKESADLSAQMFTDSGMGNEEAATASKFSKDNAARVIETEEAQGTLNSAYKETLHLLEQIIQKRQEEAQLAAQNVDKALEDLGAKKDNLANKYGEEKLDWDKDAQKPIKRIKIGEVSTSQMNEDLDKAGKYESNIDNLGRSGQRTVSLDKEAASILQTSKRSLGKGADKKQVEAVKQQESAYKKLKTAITDYDKVNTKANRSTKEGRKLINDAKKSLKDSTNEFKKASKQVKTADNTIKKYNKTTGISTEELKGVVDASAKEVDAIKKADTAKKNAEKTQDNYNKKLEEGKKVGQGWTTSFVNAMQGVASGAAGLQMITGAFDSLTTSIADGTAGFSEYLSAITSVAFGLPMLINGLGTMAKMLKLNVVWEKLLAGIKKVSDAAEDKYLAKKLARNAKEKVSDSSNIIVKWAKMLVDWPVGTLTAIALAVPIMAIIGGGIALGAISVNNKREEKQQEEADNKAIETAEGALEVAEGWNEESQAMDDLIDKHNKLKAANDQTIEGQKALKEAQQAIIDQVPQLVEKYKELDKEYENLDLSGDIALLEGAAANNDVEQIEQITNDMDAKIANETSKIAADGQKGAMRRTAAAMSEVQGDYDGKEYTVHVGGKGSYVEGLIKKSSIGADNGNDITLDMSDSKSFLKDYEELQRIAKKAEETGNTSDDAYREIIEILDASEEQYNKLKELNDKGKTYEIQDRVNQMNVDLSNIETYQNYVDLVKKLTEDKELLKIASEEEIKTWIEGQKVLSEYATLEKKALAYRDKYGKELSDSMLKQASKYTNEKDLEAFLKIDFDKYQVKETWEGLVKYIRKQEEAEAIQADIKTVSAAEKNLKSNGTVEDYQKLQESITWGEKGFIEYSEFLGKSYDEQKAYLEGMKISIAEQAQAKAKAAEQELKDTKEATQIKNDNLQTDISDLEIQITKLELAKNLSDEEKKQLEDAKNQLELKKEELAHTQIDLQNLDEEIEKNKINQELAELQVKQAKEARAQRIRDFNNSKKSYEDEYDAYKQINDISDDLSRTMSRIADAKEAAYGGDYLALLGQEIKGLETENDLLDETIKLANKRAAANKKELASDYGAKFDKNGNISNFNEIQGNYLQDLAEIEATKGKDSEEYKNKKQEYDDFMDLSEDYEAELEKSEEATDKKASNMREILDKKLEGIQYKINIKLEVNQHELNILERQLNRLTDNAYDGAARIKKYTKQTQQVYENQQKNSQGIRKTLKAAKVSDEDIEKYMSGDGGALAKYNLSSSVMEQLEEYTEGFADAQEQLEELAESIGNEVMTTFNAWHEKIADVGAAIEAQGALIKSYQNIVDIVGKDKLGLDDAALKSMESANNIAAQASLNNAKVQKETTEAALAEAREKKSMYKQGSDEYELWLKTEQELSKQLDEDTANFMSSWENALTTAYETFASETERAIDRMSDYMAGVNFDSMDDLAKSFDYQQEVSDRYLENYEKAYELSKLNRKIQKDIDSSDNVRAQKVMRDMQEEIAEKQANGVELSQHDLEILQKKYDLKLAEIALEEAQGAKNIVRLQRNSEGGFGYVYTADQSAIDNAEQNYEDKLYEMQKSNDDYIESLSKQIIDNRKAMEEEIASIDVTAYTSKEEYLKAVEEVTTKYQEREVYLLNEVQKTIDSNKDIYTNDVAAYGSFVGQKESIDQTWVTSFDQTTLSIVTGFATIDEAQANLTTAIGDPDEGTGYLGTLDTAYDTLDQNINAAMSTAGTSVTDFGTTVHDALYGKDGKGGAVGEINDLTKTTNSYGTKAEKKFGDVANKVVEWYKKYGPKLEAGRKKTDDLESSIAKLKSKSLTINTKVNGKDQVEALTEAIKDVKTAIEKLQNADFKITASVKVDNSGYDPDDTKEDKEHKQKNQATWTSVTNGFSINKDYNLNNVVKGTRFEVVARENGQSFAIYKQMSNQGQGTKSAQATWIDNNMLDDVQWERSNDYIRIDDNGNAYVTAKVVGYGTNASKAVQGQFKKGAEYYIPVENLNSWGGSNWLDEGETKTITVDPRGHWNVLRNKDGSYHWGDWFLEQTWTIDKVSKNLIDGMRLYHVKEKSKYINRTDLEQMGVNPDNYVLKRFDTGGYTGSWGPEGRMAMLHQKEIVLNAQDTENFLSAIQIVRSMVDQIDLNAAAARGGLNVYTAATIKPTADTLQQDVTIHAEFPNATDHNEIEQAFRDLTNLATQYAYR